MTEATPSQAALGAQALLNQLEQEATRIDRLRRETMAAEATRMRLEQALDAVIPTLTDDDARAARARLRTLISLQRTRDLRARNAPQAAIMDLLAVWERPWIGVGEVQGHVEERGLTANRTYAAGALKHLASQGIVQKTGHGRFRIIRSHPDLVALRLASLERELEGW